MQQQHARLSYSATAVQRAILTACGFGSCRVWPRHIPQPQTSGLHLVGPAANLVLLLPRLLTVQQQAPLWLWLVVACCQRARTSCRGLDVPAALASTNPTSAQHADPRLSLPNYPSAQHCPAFRLRGSKLPSLFVPRLWTRALRLRPLAQYCAGFIGVVFPCALKLPSLHVPAHCNHTWSSPAQALCRLGLRALLKGRLHHSTLSRAPALAAAACSAATATASVVCVR